MIVNVPTSTLQIDYRNAYYQGQLSASKRNGFGLLLTDKGELLIAHWEDDAIEGYYALLINNKFRSFGEIRKGKLVRYNVFESDKICVYGNFDNGLLDGIALIHTQDTLNVISYQQGHERNKLASQPYSKNTKILMLQSYFSDHYFEVDRFVSRLLRQRYFSENNILCREILISTKQSYFGFVDAKSLKGKGLGFIFKNGVVSCWGTFNNTQLNGVGRIFLSRDEFQDGFFVNGFLTGRGVKYNEANNTYLHGTFNIKGQKYQKGYGYPIRQIIGLRKNTHLKASVFIDQQAVIKLLVKDKIDKALASCTTVVKQPPRTNLANTNVYQTAIFKNNRGKVYPEIAQPRVQSNDPTSKLLSNSFQIRLNSSSREKAQNYVEPQRRQTIGHIETSRRQSVNPQSMYNTPIKKYIEDHTDSNVKEQTPLAAKAFQNYVQQNQQNSNEKRLMEENQRLLKQIQRKQAQLRNYTSVIKKQTPQIQLQKKYREPPQTTRNRNTPLLKFYQTLKVVQQHKAKMVEEFLNHQQQTLNISMRRAFTTEDQPLIFSSNVIVTSPLTKQASIRYIDSFINTLRNQSKVADQQKHLRKELHAVLSQELFKKQPWHIKICLSLLNQNNQVLMEIKTSDYDASWFSSKRFNLYVGDVRLINKWNKTKSKSETVMCLCDDSISVVLMEINKK